MSDLGLATAFQADLDKLNRRRESLEKDVQKLEQKINVLNGNLQKGNGSEKMLSLKQFLETEKNRIQKSKLSKIDERVKKLEEKIASARSSLADSESNHIITFKESGNVSNKILDYFIQNKSEPLPLNNIDRYKRSIKSFPETRPHSLIGAKKYCSYCLENLVSKTSIPKKQAAIQINQASMTQLPLCTTMSVCKEYNAVHNDKSNNDAQSSVISIKNLEKFLTPFSNDAQIKSYCMSCRASINFVHDKHSDEKIASSSELETGSLTDYADMLKSCESIGSCTECAKRHEQIAKLMSSSISNHVIGTSQKFAAYPIQDDEPIKSEDFEDIKSISPSILATCESYGECECCNHNLAKLDMPTPTSPIVAFTCTSQENCTKCTEILLESLSLETGHSSPKLLSQEILYKNIFRKSSINVSKIKKEIEFQSHVIYNTEEKISKFIVSTKV